MDNIITINNLSKSYGNIKAVENISLSVKRGSLFAFLGINGAGKSTVINMICTLLNKDSGDINVAGYDIVTQADKVRESIGVVFQNSILDKKLSVNDNLAIRASFYGITGEPWAKRLNELTGMLSLADILKRPYGKLSGGQKRRVDIARALINAPKILILDEPTTGLDPQTRKTVWSVIYKLRELFNMTVFLTTHYMEESNAADNVVIIDSGKIVAIGSPIELKNKYSRDKLYLYTARNTMVEERLVGKQFNYEDNRYKVYIEDGNEAKRLLAKLDDLVNDFEVIKGEMDDVFLNVTGKILGEGNEK